MNHSFLRFLVVGVINTLVGMSVIFLLLHLVGLNYWVSTAFGTLIGACVSYMLNRTFTFKSNSPVRTSLLRFSLVMAICYGVSYFISHQLSDWLFMHVTFIPLGFRPDIAVLLGMIIYTLMNYFGQKMFVFREQQVRQANILNKNL